MYILVFGKLLSIEELISIMKVLRGLEPDNVIRFTTSSQMNLTVVQIHTVLYKKYELLAIVLAEQPTLVSLSTGKRRINRVIQWGKIPLSAEELISELENL